MRTRQFASFALTLLFSGLLSPLATADSGNQGAGPKSYYLVLKGPSALDLLPNTKSSPSATTQAIVSRRLAVIAQQHLAIRPQLVSLGATVTAEFSRLANVIQVRADDNCLEAIRKLPGIVDIEAVPSLYPSTTKAVPLIGAYDLWQNTTGATGKGIRIGIVDTGIDYLHADFGGPGTPNDYKTNDRTLIEPGSFPTIKVVGGTDFVGDDYDGTNAVIPDPDPLDCARMQSSYISGGHGTHVAGTAAGNGVLADGTPFLGPYNVSLNPSSFRVGPGVAPEAELYALKVFGCDGSTEMLGTALEWAVDPNNDGDFSDRLDVVNASLGGSYGITTVTDEKLVANLTKAGTLFVVAAGNDGNTFYVSGSPSTITQTLAVAASTDQFEALALKVLSPASIVGEMPCLEGAFTKPLASTGPIEGELAATSPVDACSDLTNAAALKDKIALISRGTCSFSVKIAAAAAAGAVAVVMTDNQVSEIPFGMGGDGTKSVIPGVMIRKIDGDTIRAQLSNGVKIRLDSSQIYQSPIGADQIADFSSRGPRASDNALKPDIAAPGVAINSAGVGTGSEPREMSGTSMACPMMAGAAALVRQAKPGFSPMEVKAAIMNSVAPLKDRDGHLIPVSLGGSGRVRVDLAASRDVTVAASEPDGAVSLSFGAIISATTKTEKRTLIVTNHSDKERSFDVSVSPTYATVGVEVSASTNTVQVAAHSTASVEIMLTVVPAQLAEEAPDPATWASMNGQFRQFANEASGHVVLTEKESTVEDSLRVAYHAVVRAADQLKAADSQSCSQAGTTQSYTLDGPTTHKASLVSAFQLGAVSDEKSTLSEERRASDLLAVGAATNMATAATFDKASVYFGIVVAGQWTTPARGPLSLISVSMDTNLDGKVDYTASAEAYSKDGPYLDVLAVTTYDSKGTATASRKYINILGRDKANTEPFNNSVIILPVALKDIGLSAINGKLNYKISTKAPPMGAGIDSTSWIEFDALHPLVDTSKEGESGLPFYRTGQAIKAVLSADWKAETAPEVLVLFHTNEAGLRHQVISTKTGAGVDSSDLSIDVKAPGKLTAGETVSVGFDIRNTGKAAAKSVSLTGKLAGFSKIRDVVTGPVKGTCSTESGLKCSFEEIAAGASVSVRFTGEIAASTVSLQGSLESVGGCEADYANNTASKSIEVSGEKQDGGAEGVLSADNYDAGGGCSCEVGERGGSVAGGLMAVLMALLLGKRRGRSL